MSAPRFTQKPSLKQEGDKLIFRCELESDPAPSVTWYRGSTKLVESDRLKVQVDKQGAKFNVSLTINGVQADDGGSYKVEAKNKSGTANASINLNFGMYAFYATFYATT